MKHVKFDNGLEQLTVFDERFYTKNGKDFFPSVTTILDVYPKGFGFHQWLKDVGQNAQQVLERAGEFGSRVHEATEFLNYDLELSLFDPEGREKYSLEEWEAILRYADFWKKTNPELLANELSLCSEKLGFAGTIDRVVKMNGVRWLLDIKTSNAIHKTHQMQLSAYAQLWNEENPQQKIDKIGVIWLKAGTRTEKIDFEKDIFQGKGWQLVTFDKSIEDIYSLFLHTFAIWKEENPDFKPKNKILPTVIRLKNENKAS